MAKKTSNSSRKEPQQARSKALVDSILTAATRVLGRAGFEKASTNTIAKIAGVSIGSLYQYFPGKSSILRALIKNRVNDQLLLVDAILSPTEPQTLSTTIEKLIRMIAEPSRSNQGLSKLFYEYGPLVGTTQIAIEARQKAARRIARAFNAHAELSGQPNLEMKINILLQSILGALGAMAMDDHSDLDLESTIAELTRMSLCYLLDKNLKAVNP